MENRVPREPNQLSGGQQRGAIARTLVNRPALLLANEPTGSLDSRSGPEIRDILHQVRRNGETIVLITHIESVAISVAGGLIGVGTGIGLACGFGVLVAKAMPDGGDWGTIIQASAVLAAFYYTIAVGVCLDLHPVLKASKLGPCAVSVVKQPQTSESVKV